MERAYLIAEKEKIFIDDVKRPMVGPRNLKTTKNLS